ncbi:MAG: citrate lyase acyl carrier protein [Oscillospiraceae bacterium]|jgi:citrate lyase subunit gamma (acyl carrier protein)|nr:citrate lyase acyl carrier protein [Oscillospiraceae bacterium]
MKIVKVASAGTLESSDAFVEVAPAGEGVSLEIDSVVYAQFGEAIRQTVLDVLKDCGVEAACVRVADRGALECVLRARVETAVLRGKGEE